MGKLSRIPARKVIQKLKKAGFVETHQRGSHLYFKSEDGLKTATVSPWFEKHSHRDFI